MSTNTPGLLADSEQVFYVIRVNGVNKTTKFNSRVIAEMEIKNLPDEEKAIAEVVTVTADGSDLLLG